MCLCVKRFKLPFLAQSTEKLHNKKICLYWTWRAFRYLHNFFCATHGKQWGRCKQTSKRCPITSYSSRRKHMDIQQFSIYEIKGRCRGPPGLNGLTSRWGSRVKPATLPCPCSLNHPQSRTCGPQEARMDSLQMVGWAPTAATGTAHLI